ncbi:MAG: hypothetical protein NDJ90_06510 [Oligoflexia bacterium]|nr:hypothetical protein [Oligoflexia bacterium]
MVFLKKSLRFLSDYSFWFGLAVVLAYWYWVHPVGFSRGYAEDMCSADLNRQLMADQLRIFGRPNFATDLVMTPFGANLPYMSWSIERDWLGAFFWDWNRNFPFLWCYFGVSLLVSYVVVGGIFRKMGLQNLVAWGLALAVVAFHVPRHFKAWHHHEHLLQHWVYLSFFLDVWIVHRFWRERRFSWNLELWRGLCLVGMLGTVGIFWGPLIMEWAFVRITLLAAVVLGRVRRTGAAPLAFEWQPLRAILPILLSAALFAIAVQWYLPLYEAVRKFGSVPQGLGWFASRGWVIFPLWFPRIPGVRLAPIDGPETVVTIGWFYWVPLLVALSVLKTKRGGPGWKLAAPFIALLAVAVLYMGKNLPPLNGFQELVMSVVPTMSFFRVASRWGLFLPQIAVAVIVLAWPELRRWAAERWVAGPPARRRRFRIALGAFIVTSLIEFSWLLYPVNMMAPMPETVVTMLERIREQPGASVLNMPFCVTGGNGVCNQQCRNYPWSTTGVCLRTWHDKKVYGVYASRLSYEDCRIYDRPPFTSWFNAWGEQRCFDDSEWKAFCTYLDQHSEHAAVLVHPDIWLAAGTPACRREFDKRLGAPLGEGSYPVAPTRGGEGAWPSRLLWYRPRCAAAAAS